jgi:hypothetical protein
MESEYGFCHCNCGNKTNIATATVARLGWVRGEPLKYLMNHDKRINLEIEDAYPFKIDGVYCRLIPLTKGLYAIVDAADYRWLMTFKWCAVLAADGNGYYARARLRDGGCNVKMHRIIVGADEDEQVDHEDHCGIDNRRKNLRTADNRQNSGNRNVRRDSTTGYKGVTPATRPGFFRVSIMDHGLRRNLGQFEDPIEGAKRYDREARLVFGAFAKLNFPEET